MTMIPSRQSSSPVCLHLLPYQETALIIFLLCMGERLSAFVFAELDIDVSWDKDAWWHIQPGLRLCLDPEHKQV